MGGAQLPAGPATLPDVWYRQFQLRYFPPGASTSGKIIPSSRGIFVVICFGLIRIWANSDIEVSMTILVLE